MHHHFVTKPLARLFERLGLDVHDCVREDGRSSLPYEGGRLDIYPMPDARLVLETRIADLPDQPDARQRLLERALVYATAQMKSRPDTLALAPGMDALVLQFVHGADASALDTETAIAEFLDAADHWKRNLNSPSSMT